MNRILISPKGRKYKAQAVNHIALTTDGNMVKIDSDKAPVEGEEVSAIVVAVITTDNIAAFKEVIKKYLDNNK